MSIEDTYKQIYMNNELIRDYDQLVTLGKYNLPIKITSTNPQIDLSKVSISTVKKFIPFSYEYYFYAKYDDYFSEPQYDNYISPFNVILDSVGFNNSGENAINLMGDDISYNYLISPGYDYYAYSTAPWNNYQFTIKYNGEVIYTIPQWYTLADFWDWSTWDLRININLDNYNQYFVQNQPTTTVRMLGQTAAVIGINDVPNTTQYKLFKKESGSLTTEYTLPANSPWNNTDKNWYFITDLIDDTDYEFVAQGVGPFGDSPTTNITNIKTKANVSSAPDKTIGCGIFVKINGTPASNAFISWGIHAVGTGWEDHLLTDNNGKVATAHRIVYYWNDSFYIMLDKNPHLGVDDRHYFVIPNSFFHLAEFDAHKVIECDFTVTNGVATDCMFKMRGAW